MNTKQQEFDFVVTHLFKQGKPALSWNGKCCYRGAGGTMCAVGCRIPDSKYTHLMEDLVVSALIREFSYDIPIEIIEYELMFQDLQSLHDGFAKIYLAKPPPWDEYLKTNLPAIALTHKVEYNES